MHALKIHALALERVALWGYITFYKVSGPQKNKIRTRGFKSVFVGYAQNSKAYLLVDLKTNVIVEFVYIEF
jgi:hypothetical protein